MSVADVLRLMLAGALPSLLLALAAGGTAHYLSGQQPPVIQAEAALLVARTTGGLTQFGLSPVTAPLLDLGDYRVAASSDQVLTNALSRLGIEEPTQAQVRSLGGSVSTSTEAGARDSSLLRVVARDTNAGSAIERANTVAQSLVEWDEGRSTESLVRVIDTLERQIEATSDQVRLLEADATAPDAQGQIAGLVRLRAEQQQQLDYARALVASAQGLISVLQVADTTLRARSLRAPSLPVAWPPSSR